VEGSADLLFHTSGCGIFGDGSKTAFPGDDKVFAKGRSGKSGGGWLCPSRGLLTCPKSGTGGHSITPDDLDANERAEKPPGSDVGVGKGIQAATYRMQTFHEFLAKKAMVLPNLFRIEPFIGLAQPIPLKKPTINPGRRLGGVEKRMRVR
jgi:hypothetical protein